MTKSTFERKHPDCSVQVLHQKGKFVISARGDGWFSFVGGVNERRLYDQLSTRVLALKSRRVIDDQAGRDANTGVIGPLQAHHQVKRSAGGNHARENLAGVSAETHALQHERKGK